MIIIPILLFVFGVSYAFYQYFRLGESNNEIVAGQIYMKYTDSNKNLHILPPFIFIQPKIH